MARKQDVLVPVSIEVGYYHSRGGVCRQHGNVLGIEAVRTIPVDVGGMVSRVACVITGQYEIQIAITIEVSRARSFGRVPDRAARDLSGIRPTTGALARSGAA